MAANAAILPVRVLGTEDHFVPERTLPPLEVNDRLVLRTACAYGSSTASHDNSGPRAPEVLVDGDRFWAGQLGCLRHGRPRTIFSAGSGSPRG